MSSATHSAMNRTLSDKRSDDAAGSLDVSWLLHSKKGRTEKPKPQGLSNINSDAPPPAVPLAEPTPPQSPTEPPDTSNDKAIAAALEEQVNGDKSRGDSQSIDPKTSSAPAQPATPSAVRPPLAGRGPSNDENKAPGLKGPVSTLKSDKGGRRSSWISSLSSKFSSSNSPTPPRSGSVDVAAAPTPQGTKSPKVEFGNPFDKKDAKQAVKKDKKEEKQVITHISPQPPRRQSVLVHAGQETKVGENPGFLSSALRRLSSSNNATLGKGAGSGAVCVRKTMNIDQNRDRVKITEFDQNNLKRVAFCVDVEIAGYAVQADEDDTATKARQLPAGQRQSLASLERQANIKKQGAAVKDKGEGAALKNPQAASEEKEELGATKADTQAAIDASKAPPPTDDSAPTAEGETKSESQPIPTTKKKEKKKRSEAERKERRERKRRQAEANGLVPLELSPPHDDDSDSSPSVTPPGATTPNIRPGDQPTTDPLRIYKRCCQLRETTALDRVKEQISKPSATLAEASGTVAVVDLSGTQMPLQDVVTLGDWLAVVPVRKLILDDCSLTDEALRVILSGLAGCKSLEQAKQNRKLPRRGSGKRGQEQLGVIEKLSLKNNSGITKLGWKHIALFLHISRSLRAIDLSGIPFPTRAAEPIPGDLSRSTTTSSNTSNGFSNGLGVKSSDVGTLFTRALSERFAGERLEELIMSNCGLANQNVADLVDAAIKCKIRRLGLAENHLSLDALSHVVRYVKSGVCEGLDLGGNDLHNSCHLIADAVNEENPMFAISWANCNLGPKDLESILIPLTKLKNFKFMDLSRNSALFSGSGKAVPVFRKFLPKLKALKRLHLCDVDMGSDDVIALSEVFPDCAGLAHISILDNAPLIKAMNSTDNGAQEEACAFLASLMTAVRVSHSIVAVELEMPSADSSEVVKALASQVVAYSLRNMEHETLDEFGVPAGNLDKDAPEVLLHLVGHMNGYTENHDNDEPAPDEDYMIASTGIAKALGVCLETKDHHSRSASRNITPTASGTATPRQGPLRAKMQKKPKDVSLELCESARKIRMRLRPALIKEDRAGNMMNYRRLLALDGTLERIIQRFEDEYPETKVPSLPASPPSTNGLTSLGSSIADASMLSGSVDSNELAQIPSQEDYPDETPLSTGDRDPYSLKLSRTPSNTSLAAKALTYEEGRMLRFGQSMRRDILKPTGTDDFEHGTSVNDPPEPEHLAALRTKLEAYQGEEIRRKVEEEGADSVIHELGINAEELMALQKEDPEGFKAFRQSQLAAQINAGMVPDPRNGNSGSGDLEAESTF